jgi:hypothetical protein
MTVNLEEISRRLDIPPDELVKRGLLTFVAHEVRLAEWDIADIKERYGVSTRAELEEKIKIKALSSHPAWEDLIHWESLDAYLDRLRAIEEEVKVAP